MFSVMRSECRVQTVGNVPSRSHAEVELAYVGTLRARADELTRHVSRNSGVTLDGLKSASTGTCKWQLRT